MSKTAEIEAIMKLVYEYNRYKRKQIKYGGTISFESFMDWLDSEGYYAPPRWAPHNNK